MVIDALKDQFTRRVADPDWGLLAFNKAMENKTDPKPKTQTIYFVFGKSGYVESGKERLLNCNITPNS